MCFGSALRGDRRHDGEPNFVTIALTDRCARVCVGGADFDDAFELEKQPAINETLANALSASLAKHATLGDRAFRAQQK